MRLDIMKGLQAPFSDQNWVTKLLIGTALVLFSWLVIPIFFITGYSLSVIRETADGAEDLPEFSWGAQGISGAFTVLALFILNLIPSAIMGFGVFSIVAAIMSGGVLDPKAWMAALMGAGAVSLGLIGLGMLMMFVISFFAPALFMRYAVTGDFGSLFGFGQAISDIMASPLDYLVIFLLPNILGFAFSAVSSLLFGLPLILAPTFSFALAIISAKLMGDYYRLCLN